MVTTRGQLAKEAEAAAAPTYTIEPAVDLVDPFANLFPSALLRAWDDEPIHVVELAMREMSYAIRSKKDWHLKRRQPHIVANWRKEAGNRISDSAWDYMIQELDDYERVMDPQKGISVSCVDGIWEAAKLLPTSLRSSLMKRIEELRQLPEKEKDYHPGSNGKVRVSSRLNG
jgi:hypothetical protein